MAHTGQDGEAEAEIEMTDKRKPWKRQRGEPNLWYDRFTRFRLMKAERSFLGCYKLWLAETGRKRQRPPTRAPQTWHDAAEKWEWRRRAEAWDNAERRRREAEYDTERIEWREKRRKLLQGFFGKLVQALNRLDPADASMGQLTQAIKVSVQELRAEFDDLPKERQVKELSPEVVQVIGQLAALVSEYVPEEKRDELKEALQKWLQE